MFQTKKQDKTLGKKKLNEMEKSNLPEWEFNVTVRKMFTGLERRVGELSENFQQKEGNTKKNWGIQ